MDKQLSYMYRRFNAHGTTWLLTAMNGQALRKIDFFHVMYVFHWIIMCIAHLNDGICNLIFLSHLRRHQNLMKTFDYWKSQADLIEFQPLDII